MNNPPEPRKPLDPLSDHAVDLLMQVRQALLMVVDALEVYLGFIDQSRTSALRKKARQTQKESDHDGSAKQ